MTTRPDALDLARRWATPPSPADAEAVRNLLTAYATFTDRGAVDDLATLFTADAEWDGSELGYGTASGPLDIARRVAGHHRPDEPMAHLPGPPLLVARSPTEVDALSWCLATRSSGGILRPTIYFSYEDRIIRTADGWRFRQRVLRATFPGSMP